MTARPPSPRRGVSLVRGAVRALVAAVCVLAPTGVAAQSTGGASGGDPGNPFPAQFGGANAEQLGNTALNLSMAFFGGYDDDIFARGQNSSPNAARVSGPFLGSQTSATYVKRFSSGLFSARGASSARYLTETQEMVPTFHFGSAEFTKAFNSRTSVSIRQVLLYRPFFSAAPFAGQNAVDPTFPSSGTAVGGEPDGLIGGGPDDSTLASDRTAWQYLTSGTFTRRITPRARLQFFGVYGQSRFDEAEDGTNVDNARVQARGSFIYDLTTFLAARLGYGYRYFGTVTEDRDAANHDVDVGLLLNKPFQIRRGQTEFSATTGTTLLVRERVNVDGSAADRVLFRFIGTGQVRHTFTRDWVGDVTYTHSVGYIDGFVEPVEGDRVAASLSGLLTRSLELQVQASYLSGAIGLQDRNFDTGIAGARLRYALNQKLALFAQYFYFQYTYDDDIASTLLTASDLERQGFRVGLTVWLPVVRQR